MLQRVAMNWQHIESKWDEMKGKVREQWGKLTDDDLDQIGGTKDRLIAKLRERYADQKDEIDRRVDRWIESM
jgi:uncharacterized protein YjbJ (UPF0337 family)